MDAIQFTAQAKQDPQVNALLQQIAADSGQHLAVQEPQRYLVVGGADILLAIAAYALYRWLKDYFDHRRALNEVEIVREQEQVIAALIDDGFRPEQAQAVTLALLKQVAERGADDPALKMAAGLLGK